LANITEDFGINMSSKKNIKVIFAPNAFDDWEGTQEELDEFLEELIKKIETGDIFNEMVEAEDIEIDDIELEKLPPRKLH